MTRQHDPDDANALDAAAPIHYHCSNMVFRTLNPQHNPPKPVREWVNKHIDVMLDADGVGRQYLRADDAYTLADRCDEAERERDDKDAGWRTYAGKCAELQAELDKARERIARLSEPNQPKGDWQV